MGKQAVQAIDILKQSSKFESVLNKNIINSIEVVMKETVDVKGYFTLCCIKNGILKNLKYLMKFILWTISALTACVFLGRTSFYDSYGVVSDVIQNHLSEILYKITKDSSSDLQGYEEDKLKLQDQVSAVNKNKNVVFGQYKGTMFFIKFESNNIILIFTIFDNQLATV